MILNLFHDQWIRFYRLVKRKKGKKGKKKMKKVKVTPDWEFKSEHGTVYILKASDDLYYKHEARFKGAHVGKKARVALIFRWLTRRQDVYCMDYDGARQGREKHPNVNKFVDEVFTDPATREIFHMPPRILDYAKHPLQKVTTATKK
jgi:predicted RNase H-like nuclease